MVQGGSTFLETNLELLRPLISVEKFDELRAAENDAIEVLRSSKRNLSPDNQAKVESLIKVISQFCPILRNLTKEFESDCQTFVFQLKSGTKTLKRHASKIFGFSLMLKLCWTWLDDLSQINGLDDDDLQNLLAKLPDLKNIDDEIRNRFQDQMKEFDGILDKKLAKLSPAQSMSESDADLQETSSSGNNSEDTDGQAIPEIPSENQAAANPDKICIEEKLENLQLNDSAELKAVAEDRVYSLETKKRLTEESLNKHDCQMKPQFSQVHSWLNKSSGNDSNSKLTPGADPAVQCFPEKKKTLARSKSVFPGRPPFNFNFKSNFEMNFLAKTNEELPAKELKRIEKTSSAQSTDSAVELQPISAANSEAEINSDFQTNFNRHENLQKSSDFQTNLSPHETLRKSWSAQSKDSAFGDDSMSANDFNPDNEF